MKALISASAYQDASIVPGYRKARSLEKIGDKTLLELQIAALKNAGVEDIYVSLPRGTRDLAPSADFGEGVHLLFVEPGLSTGGAIPLCPRDDDLLFVPGDLLFDVDLERFLSFHQEKGGYLTCLSHPEAHPEKKDVLLVKPNGQGFIILPKETTSARDFDYANLVPTDLCILSADLLETFDDEDLCPMDFRREVFEPTLAIEGLFSYLSPEYVKALESKADKDAFARDLQKGIPSRKNLKNPQTAFFLDRDGTINIFGDYVVKPEMLQLIPGAAKAIKRINDEGYLAICVTNQPVVARGEASPEQMRDILWRLELLLGKEGAHLDAIYFCPHYPKAYEGSNPDYTKECRCRKPKIGMLLEAQKEFHVDLASSWFIGDTTRDVQTGLNAGTHTALLLGGDPNPGKRYGDAKPEKIYPTLSEAIDDILG